MKKKAALTFLSILAVSVAGCSIDDPLTLLRCRFRVENTEDFALAGILLDDLESLSASQVAELVSLWASGSLPVDFTLNIGIFNPNDGSTGPDIIPVSLTEFVWDLYLDTDPEDGFDTTWVASGTLAQPLEIPGSGETVLLPLDISFDAVALMSELGALQFIDLALAIGGIDSGLRDDDHLGRILVVGVPTISTPVGPMTYSGALNINLDWVD
ncbi:MAG: hypothetical protein AVO35_11380 [Candidatus Aegiribacteria sp. MLS_C]|nr:MAG: hypothetical protein AVO35_11380 [Candidatus Aegiribacteria sp. MLS_C]